MIELVGGLKTEAVARAMGPSRARTLVRPARSMPWGRWPGHRSFEILLAVPLTILGRLALPLSDSAGERIQAMERMSNRLQRSQLGQSGLKAER